MPSRIIVSFLFLALLFGCASPGGTRIDNIPMYGQPEIPRPDFMKKGDEEFINKVMEKISSREVASTMWWQQGDQYLNQGNIDFAMRRYNQSWLLNPNNYQPYWGFGRVAVAQGKYDESIKYLKKANELIHDDYQKVALLADMGAAYSYAANGKTNNDEREQLFKIANQYFIESTKLDSSYGKSWLQWAFSLYREGNYGESWKKLKKAKSMGESADVFQKNLGEKMPEPKK